MTITTTPRATARLQLHRHFTLDDATAVVPYYAALGVSHLYTSPLLTARPGSMHGYDIVDHGAINPELGGEPALRRLVSVLRQHDMGLIADIVPNHMGVGGGDNAWWLDVLEWGRASPYATFFDIDWQPPDPALHDRVLAPFLGAPYGKCLEAGEIALRFFPDSGQLAAVYGEHVFPINPQTYSGVFGDRFSGPARLPAAGDRRREALRVQGVLRQRAADPEVVAALNRFDPALPEGQARLHALLERQHYRLAWWRAAADEINWRRFFDITSLAGLRVEIPTVFDATHALILQLYHQGLIDGVRIDHVDGLADPRAYCRKLRRRMESAGSGRPADAPSGPPYIVVEKILAPHERLSSSWLVDGTTGYDFMDQVSAVLHDPTGEAPLTNLWVRRTHSRSDFDTEQQEARRLTLREALSSELNATAAGLHRVARRDLATRDYTLTAIRRALTEILVHFPVYRVYAGLAGRSESDDKVIIRAMAGARRTIRVADIPLLDLICDWLGGDPGRNHPPGPKRLERQRAIVRFEQLSSPVAAKSVEDTAFYRYGRLLSRNEVGSDPGNLALSPAAFHAACRARAGAFPAAMLATATHDHKRGEDVRARLAVLSEVPDLWEAQTDRWMRLNASARRQVDGGLAPAPADETMLYQMLVGAWPYDLDGEAEDKLLTFGERIGQWQEKALREAKRHTNWVAPNVAYEAACRDFLLHILDPSRPARVAQDVAAFAHRIAVAGAVNSLSQTVLRLTVPGVPDLYQGTDLWDLSLVDPDNRRPVDFAQRRAMLAEQSLPDIDTWRDGRIKQALIARVLSLRARQASLFAIGRYLPLAVRGPAANHVLAFARVFGSERVVIAVTRLPAHLLGAHDVPLPPAHAWNDTDIMLPRKWGPDSWTDALTGAQISGRPAVANLFSRLPVAVMVRDRGTTDRAPHESSPFDAASTSRKH